MSTLTPQTLLIMSALHLFWTPNSAFRSIGDKILTYLDPKSLGKCRLVSKRLEKIPSTATNFGGFYKSNK